MFVIGFETPQKWKALIVTLGSQRICPCPRGIQLEISMLGLKPLTLQVFSDTEGESDPNWAGLITAPCCSDREASQAQDKPVMPYS